MGRKYPAAPSYLHRQLSFSGSLNPVEKYSKLKSIKNGNKRLFSLEFALWELFFIEGYFWIFILYLTLTVKEYGWRKASVIEIYPEGMKARFRLQSCKIKITIKSLQLYWISITFFNFGHKLTVFFYLGNVVPPLWPSHVYVSAKLVRVLI